MGEIEVLRVLSHERIVQYYGTEQRADSLCIFMEYVSGVRCRSLRPHVFATGTLLVP